jgi:putative heme-binding domain-containing protein
MPAGWEKVRDRLSKEDGARGMADELSAVFGDNVVLKQMRERLIEVGAPIKQRQRALAILTRVGDRETVTLYPQLLEDDGLRPQVIPLAARSSDPAIAKTLLGALATYSAEEKAAALGVLSSRPEFASQLLSAIEEEQLEKKELSALHIRQIHTLGNADLTKRLETVYGKIGVSSDEAKALIAKLKKTYTTAPLWAFSEDRGREVFQKRCAVCHPLDGSTIPLGPSLKGSFRNGLDYFLENIVDPNAVVGENYRMTLIATQSGEVVTGLLDKETDTAVVLRTAEKTISVPKAEIEQRKIVDQSLMPTGLFDNMTEIETIELLKFLLRRE